MSLSTSNFNKSNVQAIDESLASNEQQSASQNSC